MARSVGLAHLSVRGDPWVWTQAIRGKQILEIQRAFCRTAPVGTVCQWHDRSAGHVLDAAIAVVFHGLAQFLLSGVRVVHRGTVSGFESVGRFLGYIRYIDLPQVFV